MLKRIWFPGIIALIILGLIYWFGFRTHTSITPTGSTNQEPSNQQLQGQVSPQTTSDNTKDMQNASTATIHTSMGDITIQFDKSAAPNTVANFIKLASSGFYDQTKFHRVIKGFMNQGGDPFTKDDSLMDRWGTGGPGYKFADEIGPNNHNDVGTIAMANAGPNTNGSQFFINAAANNFLDTKHTVFGKVTAGLDVVMAINSTPTDDHDRPLTPVVVNSITLK